MVASGRLNTSVPLLCKVKATFGCTKAMRSNSVRILLSSVAFDLRNFLLAGTLKKRFFTVKLLPLGQETVSCDINFEPDITNRVPNSSSSIRVLSSTSATAAIDANASPLKPIVWRLNKSAASRILDVA